ncbi:hypothetical protein [Polaribacter cellanae]|uniref:Uncharacterized protein n=1 Tax=Polaribacter cellanae TaxID=2818493 RepID=A0A975CP67_9FLAO|nr:hypothetical protein [Polaribacter cellanae]QTE21312.1 hypothetical protein J3359_10775 [Polaribacter cellanae]
MADYYRGAIEKGLRDYATSIGKTFPDQLYKDLAWFRLQGTKAWSEMYADLVYREKEQDRIKNSINNFNKTGTNECQ